MKFLYQLIEYWPLNKNPINIYRANYVMLGRNFFTATKICKWYFGILGYEIVQPGSSNHLAGYKVQVEREGQELYLVAVLLVGGDNGGA
jgi:hypothetical protein